MKTLVRIVIAAAMLAAAAASFAASLAERSPFAQGHWWDPKRPGSGFDFFSAGGQVVVNWYTYDLNGRPIWYTAQGPLATLGFDAWPLLKHRWVNGKKADPVTVGELRVVLRNSEQATVEWTVNGIPRSASIVPFVQAGATLEVDHTGSWFAPDNSGWGFALTQQGNVLGGVLFTYDTAGEPVWVAGFGRDPASIELFQFSGSCPSCPYLGPPASTSVGRLGFDFTAEWQMSARASGLALAMAPGVRVDAARMFQLSVPASARSADRQLAAFATAARLKAYLDAGMLNIPAVTIYVGNGQFWRQDIAGSVSGPF